MIVPMKKVYILLRQGWADEAISQLGEAGVLHVTPAKRPRGKALSELRRKQAIMGNVLPLLEGGPQEANPVSISIDEAVDTCERYMDLSAEKEKLQGELTGLQEEYNRTAVWGDFDRGDIASLRESGFLVKLFTCSDDELNQIPEGTAYSVITRDGDTCFVAFVTGEDAAHIPFTSVDLPHRAASEVKAEMDHTYDRMGAIESEQDTIAGRRPEIAGALKEVEGEVAFESVRAGMGEDEDIAYIAGFVPARNIEEVDALAAKNGWGFMASDPDTGDDVPTLLEHSRITALFQPVMNFIGVQPGYFEFDTNGIFLLFFSLFFAMIVGDGGYGILILGGALAAGRLFPKLPKETARLFVVLSVTTILWGGVTGNWFGLDAEGVPLLGNLVWPRLSSLDPASGKVVMEICFLLALLHLAAAHLWKGLLYLPSMKAIAEAGWIMLLAGIYMIVRFLVVKADFPETAFPFILAGFIMVLIFSGQESDGFAEGLKRGLQQFPLSLLDGIGGLSNIVSYLRLFAVGIASKEVAVAFNHMAFGFGFDSVASILLALFVLLFGHAVNLILIAMSVIVHGIRLNILEFSGQMKMEWSGVPYEPFGGRKKDS